MKTIIKECKDKSKKVGVFTDTIDGLKFWSDLNVDFIEYGDREIEDAIKFDAEQDLDEPDPAVFRTILELTVNQSGNFSDRVATKEVKANLKQDEIELTSQNINAIAKRIGFEVKNHAGRMYIKLHTNPQKRKAQMQRIANQVDYHDEVLKD